MSIGDEMRGQAMAYFASTTGMRTAAEPQASILAPLWSVSLSEQVAQHHYWRFVLGAADDHAIAGWRAVMDGRRRAARKAARQLEVAIAATKPKETTE